MSKDFQHTEKPIDIKKYLYLILNNWYWLLLSLSVTITSAYFINRYAVTSYKSSVTLIVEDIDENKDVMMQFKSVRTMQRAMEVNNEITKLKSYKVARRTVDKLNYDIEYLGYGFIRERKLFNNKNIIITPDSATIQPTGQLLIFELINGDKVKIYPEFDKDDITIISNNSLFTKNGYNFKVEIIAGGYKQYGIKFYNKNQLANYYKNSLEVYADEKKGGTVINLSITSEIPEQAVEYINTLCTEYISYNLENKNQMSVNTLSFIDQQLKVVTDSLNLSEKLMLIFRVNNGVIDLNKQTASAFNKVEQFNDKKTELLFKQKYYDYLKKYVFDKNNPKMLILPSLLNVQEPVITSLINELIAQYNDKEEKGLTDIENNPALDAINKRISFTREKLIESLNSLIKNNSIELSEIDREIARINILLKDIPKSEREMLSIQRKYELNNKFYNFLLERRAEAGIKKASNVSNIRVLDDAMVENVSVLGSKKGTNYSIAFLLGIGLPFLIIFLIDYFNPRISSREDIESRTSIPIIGVLGHDYTDTDIPVITNPKSVFAEAFRMIRTNLQYILREPDKKVIMVTSTISGEGKTFVTLNLATILAMMNKKVLLVGMDLRKPLLHKLLKNSNECGISTFLIGKSTFDEVNIKLDIENLYFAPAGPIPPNPSELLETDMLKKYIDEAVTKFDYVIIDTPPIGLVTDALIISEHCNASLYIVRQKYSHKDSLDLINKLYNEHKLTNVNILVNDVKATQSMGYKYYYGYSYSYGYGYHYGYYKNYSYQYDYNKTEKDQSKIKRIINWFKSEM